MAKAKTKLVRCAFCKGSGVSPRSGTFSPKRCPTCHGVGKVWM